MSIAAVQSPRASAETSSARDDRAADAPKRCSRDAGAFGVIDQRLDRQMRLRGRHGRRQASRREVIGGSRAPGRICLCREACRVPAGRIGLEIRRARHWDAQCASGRFSRSLRSAAARGVCRRGFRSGRASERSGSNSRHMQAPRGERRECSSVRRDHSRCPFAPIRFRLAGS